MGLATGGTVLIGQYIGAGRQEDLRRTVGTMFTLFSLLAVGLAVIFALLTPGVVTLMRVPGEAAAPARSYLFICSCGVVFITGYNMVSAILRGMGDSKRPMYFVAVACLCNIAGDLLLVGGLGMGATGAAVATVAPRGSACCSPSACCAGGISLSTFKRSSFVLRRDKTGPYPAPGDPGGPSECAGDLSFLIITAVNGMA